MLLIPYNISQSTNANSIEVSQSCTCGMKRAQLTDLLAMRGSAKESLYCLGQSRIQAKHLHVPKLTIAFPFCTCSKVFPSSSHTLSHFTYLERISI
jgi:hypothetical protein